MTQKGKKILRTGTGIIVMILAAVLLASPAAAHPPSDMVISSDDLAKNLQVTITHPVPNPQGHYIKDVTVTVNGKVVNDSVYTSQPSPGTFTYSYPVQANPGDTVDVTATCALSGSLTRQRVVPGPAGTVSAAAQESPVTQKAAWGAVPLLGAAAIIFWRRK